VVPRVSGERHEGGAAQGIKLAAELQRGRRGTPLHLLDEPTTGRHPAEIGVLTAELHELVDAVSTVVTVERDRDSLPPTG
jgi:excinuclease ABC subunit A